MEKLDEIQVVDDWHDKLPKIYFPKFLPCFLKFAWHDKVRVIFGQNVLKTLLSKVLTVVTETVECFMLVATVGTSV